MLDQLRQIAIFAKTVDHGSFRAAARALDISPSVVSHHIAQLEAQLGTALLYRSTRRLSLTGDGERLLAEARIMIDAAEAGLQAVADHAAQPSGTLTVTAPAVLAHSNFVDQVAAFTKTYPRVRLDLDFSDLRRELIADGIDVAIRMGTLRDSALLARKLQDVERKLVAARTYMKGRPAPAAPDDVAAWDWVELAQAPRRPEFRKPGAPPVRIDPEIRINVNDAHALYRLARAGAGLAILPDFLVEADLASGDMIHVLADWSVAPVGVYAVWPPNAPKGGLTARFVESLAGRTAVTR